MKRLLCLALVLLMLLPLFSVTASASESTATVTVNIYYLKGRYYGTYTFLVGEEPMRMYAEDYIRVGKAVYEYECFRVGDWYPKELIIPAYDGSEEWKAQWGQIDIFYDSHEHEFTTVYDRKNHWEECDCGEKQNKKPHVDPAKDDDKICGCGYVFSNNADLVTLWLEGMVLSPRFDKEITEYTANVHTYKDFTATKVKTETFDALAKVELPKDLTLQEGENTFQITVTAEDTVTTKTYTVTAYKTAKAQGVAMPSDDDAVTVAPKKSVKWRTATIAVTDAVGLKLAQAAEKDGLSQMIVAPDFSKWGIDTAVFTFSDKVLKEMADKTDASLTVKTTYGVDVTVPNDTLTELAEAGKTIAITVEKDGTFSIQADGADLAKIPEAIKVSIA